MELQGRKLLSSYKSHYLRNNFKCQKYFLAATNNEIS